MNTVVSCPNEIHLLQMIKDAKNIEEVRKLSAIIPSPPKMEHSPLDDGIYDESGLLIGEKHPDD